MFESIERGARTTKDAFAAAEPTLRTALLAAQRRLADAGVPVVVVIAGVEGAGKGRLVDRLNTWLDPRHVDTHAFWEQSLESGRPRWWRFWKRLPARGRIAILFGSWYTAPILAHAEDALGAAAFDAELVRIHAFERLLADDGVLVVKFWLHLTRKQQQRRLDKDVAAGRTPSPLLKEHAAGYDAIADAAAHALRATDSTHAVWHLVDAGSRRHRELIVGQTLLERIDAHLLGQPPLPPAVRRPVPTGARGLASVDLTARLPHDGYDADLEEQQDRLGDLAWRALAARLSTVMVFEGWDAAGKGGAIRRVTSAIDARLYRAIRIGAPDDVERARHYLWRFWRDIPAPGLMTIFDRSWYGRVLVERVEQLATPGEWGRAYAEIREFEAQLVDHGIVLVKFWLHISPEEQLRRFEERERVAWKRHKITREDWRNRERWDDYRAAVEEMIARTSTAAAPWTLVPAEDKRFARVTVLRELCARLEDVL